MKIIENARICDGFAHEPYEGYVVYENGTILEIGHGPAPDGTFEIRHDAQGKIVTAAFIDTHTHSDISAWSEPTFLAQRAQGVGAEITGNCGMSCFPVTDANRAHLEALYAQYGCGLKGDTYAAYAENVARLHPGIDLYALVGHNTLRAAVCGYADKPVTHAAIERMKSLLDAALSQGALGLSFGLIYIPGKFCSTDELKALLPVLGTHHKPLTVHLRSEGDRLLEAFDEMTFLAESCGVEALHISHLKTALPRNWHKIDALLERFERPYPFQLTADRYPFTESMTTLSIIAPPPLDKLDDAALQEVLKEPAVFAQCVNALRTEREKSYWQGVRLVSTTLNEFKPFLGKILTDIAAVLKRDVVTLCAEILRDDAVNAQAAFNGMNEANMKRIVQAPFVMCCSDENVKPLDGRCGRSHIRGWGSFPEFLRIAREKLTLCEALSKMNALPAKTFHLAHRGVLARGFKADFALLDLENYVNRSTFENPHVPACGAERMCD